MTNLLTGMDHGGHRSPFRPYNVAMRQTNRWITHRRHTRSRFPLRLPQMRSRKVIR